MDDPDSTRSRPGAAERVPGLSPVRAFFLLAAVAAVIPLGIFATRDEAAPSEPPAAVRSPDYSLTDAEAVAEFERLHHGLRAASIHRDVSLLDEILSVDSPLHKAGRIQLRKLIRDRVLDHSRFRTENIALIENGPTRIEIEQRVRIQPRFVSESTRKDVSGGRSLLQEVRWVLVLQETEWRIYDSVVTSSRVVS
jgi:hypothetical protein